MGALGALLRSELLGRETLLYLLVTSTAAAAGMVFLLNDGDAGLWLGWTFVLMPLALAPVAAFRASVGRRRRLAQVLAASPVPVPASVLAKVIGLACIAVLQVALALPLLYAVSADAAAGAFWQVLPWAGWALLVGVVAALWGLLAGYATMGRTSMAVAGGFGVVLAWVGLTSQAEVLLRLAGPGRTQEWVNGLIHLSPLTWAADAIHDASTVLVQEQGGLVLGCALLGTASLGVLLFISMVLQGHDAWRSDRRRQLTGWGSVALVAISVIVVLGAWPLPPPPERLDLEGADGELQTGPWFADVSVAGHDPVGSRAEQGGTLLIALLGPPNGTVSIDGVSFASSSARVALLWQVPRTVHLGNTTVDHQGLLGAAGERVGYAAVTMPIRLEITRLATWHVIDVTMTLDGQEATTSLVHPTSSWHIAAGRAVVVAGVVVGSMAAALALLPRRWNRW